MKKTLLMLAMVATAAAGQPDSQCNPSQSSAAMQMILDADQADLRFPLAQWPEVVKRRAARSGRVDELVACGGLLAKAWVQASIIKINSPGDDAVAKALEFANVALAIDPDAVGARKQIANAIDKRRLRAGLPQLFGTQWAGGSMQPIAKCAISNQTRRQYDIEAVVIASQPETCN